MAGIRPINAKYGTPVEMKPEPAKTAVLRSVALGFTTGAEAPQLPPGMSSRGSNWLDIEGGLVMRPGLRNLGPASAAGSVRSTVSQMVTWIGEGATGAGTRIPLALSGKFPAIYTVGSDSWSTLSQVGPTGLSGNTLHIVVGASDVKHFDATQYYHPTSDEFEMCFVHSQATGGAYTWRPGTTVFSTLTTAPQAGLVCAFDSRLLFSRISSAGTLYPQRVQWSARGAPETYTTPDGGFEELMDAHGVITRLVNDYDRVLVFFDQEVWQGIKYAFPWNFQFLPIDRTVGCPAARSIARTPIGVIFLGSDLNLYVIPRGGTPRPIGGNVRQLLQDDLNFLEWTDPETVRVYGMYDETRNGYLLLYDARASRVLHGLFLNLATGTASPLNITNTTATTQWLLRAVGETRLPDSNTTTIQRQRILLSGEGNGRFVAEWTSESSAELTIGPSPAFSLVTSAPLLATRQVMIPNPDPSEKLYIREMRLDYRTNSSASVSIGYADDFFHAGSSRITYDLALPVNAISAQTRVPGGIVAVYPSIRIASSGFTGVVIQGLTATIESMGNG